MSGLQEELNEAKQAMLESEKKLKFKEETAAAAMSTRDAAIKSLRLANMRASRLGERVEELSRHLEESDTREDSRNGSRQRYVLVSFLTCVFRHDVMLYRLIRIVTDLVIGF
ncbi:Myosin-10-like [Thalictrum thalictroides]|uniref:Myosin-10-like n=1 Tax=Thalictrum thalictroides TaxID=46969 RepID=A0A7J6W0A6_THATH|nr:Myosin-10-like [Thalictrum thalictroides]